MNKKNKNQISRERSISVLSDAAFLLFKERGYHATSLDAIAAEAGLSKGAIYFFFGSKENLVVHLFEIIRAEIIEPQIVAIESTQGEFVDRVVAYIHVGSAAGVDRPDKLLFLIRMSIEFGKQDNSIGEGIRSLYSEVYARLESVYIGERKADDALASKAKVVSSMVVAVHDGMMLQYHLRESEIGGSELVRNVREMILNGLHI